MSESLVLTIIGDDRPGLVETVARVVAEHGGNWIESRMAKLSGKFAGVLRVSVPNEKRDAMVAALGALAGVGLHVQAESTGGDAEAEDAARTGLTLELLGHDRPGIVREISAALAQRGFNVIELTTAVESAPMSGEELFKATAKLTAAADANIDELHTELDRIADELDLDLSLAMRL